MMQGEYQFLAQDRGTFGVPAAEAVADLVAALNQPRNLIPAGVTRDDFAVIANGAMQNVMVRGNPRPNHDPEQVLEILELAWQGS